MRIGLRDPSDGGGMPEEFPYCRQDDVDPTRAPYDARNRGRRAVGVKVLQPVDEAPELTRGRAPVAFDRGAPLEEQRERAGVRLRGRLGTVTTHAEMQEPVVGCLDGAVSQIDYGPVALARGQFDPKRSERPHQVRPYGPQPSATVSDTPSDRVAHHRQHRSVQPSPTAVAPVQKEPLDQAAAWRRVGSAYMVCTEDTMLPLDYQRPKAELMNHRFELRADHSPFASTPDELAGILVAVASG